MTFLYFTIAVVVVWIALSEWGHDKRGPKEDAYLGTGVFLFLFLLATFMIWTFLTNLPGS